MPFELRDDPGVLDALAGAWDALAEAHPHPFLSHAFLSAWWSVFGGDRGPVVASVTQGGTLTAAALLVRTPLGGLEAAANEHNGIWGPAARDGEATADVWRGLAHAARGTLTLRSLPGVEEVARARGVLRAHGWRSTASLELESPYLPLPATFDDLLAARTQNFRSQVRRRTRKLERTGRARFVCVTDGPRVDELFDELLRVEAAGWKGRAGTSIAADPAAERLYRRFAHALAELGWLRLYALEIDGRVVAADLGCAMGGVGFLIKTGFDEAHGDLAPGFVLRAKVVEASIEEGLGGYDFLGGPEHYKLRWTSQIRPRATVRAFRGAAAVAAAGYRRAAKPLLRTVVSRAR